MRRAALATLILLCCATTAHADDWVRVDTGVAITDQRIANGERAALAYWGRLPQCAMRWTFIRVSATTATPSAGPPLMSAQLGGCQGWANESWYLSAADFAVCQNTVHEIGHMLGFGHGEYPEDPERVMLGKPTSACGPAPRMNARSPYVLADRSWCRRHRAKCEAKYPALFRAALPHHGPSRSM